MLLIKLYNNDKTNTEHNILTKIKYSKFLLYKC